MSNETYVRGEGEDRRMDGWYEQDQDSFLALHHTLQIICGITAWGKYLKLRPEEVIVVES